MAALKNARSFMWLSPTSEARVMGASSNASGFMTLWRPDKRRLCDLTWKDSDTGLEKVPNLLLLSLDSRVSAAEITIKKTPDKRRKIVIGRFGAPFGIHGRIRVIVFGDQFDSFHQNRKWLCALPNADSFQQLEVEDIRPHANKGLSAKLAGIEQREDAAKWTNGQIAVERDELPALSGNDEYYWCDLIGLRALDVEGETLGEIAGLMRGKAGDILRITPKDGKEEILVPFVAAHVMDVDFTEGVIRLHWRRDW